MWRSAFSENFTSRVSGIVPLRKIELGLGGPTPWSTSNWRKFFNEATALLSQFFLGSFVGLPFNLLLLENTLFAESAFQWFLAIQIFGRTPKITRWFRALTLEDVSARFSSKRPNRTPPVGRFSNLFDHLSRLSRTSDLGVDFLLWFPPWRKLQLSPFEHCPAAVHR